MVHEEKNIKTKLPLLQIHIGFWVQLRVFLAIIGM